MTRASFDGVRRAAGVAIGVLVLTALAGCGGDDTADDATGEASDQSASPTEPAEPTEASPTASASPAGDPPPPDGKPFGAECGKFRARGVPVGDLDDRPFRLWAVVQGDVDLFFSLLYKEGLDTREDATYFLPTNEAVDLLPSSQLADLSVDERIRAEITGRHVLDGRLRPSTLAGEHETVNGGTLQVSVDGADVRVGLQRARVLCGNIDLDGVTVYLIDQILLS